MSSIHCVMKFRKILSTKLFYYPSLQYWHFQNPNNLGLDLDFYDYILGTFYGIFILRYIQEPTIPKFSKEQGWFRAHARSELGIFEGARARVLNSEHMLGLLVLGLDARRVLGKHQRITEQQKMWEKHRKNRQFKLHS